FRSNYRMTPFARARTSEWNAGSHLPACLMQAFHQIVWQKRAITRHAEDPFNALFLLRQPVETGENSGQRTGKIGHAVAYNGKAGVGEALGVAVGVDNDARALRRQCCQHTIEHRYAANLDACLVAAAHAASEAPGEHESEGRGMISRHAPPLCADAWRF